MIDYHSRHRVAYRPTDRLGYCYISVLEFLNGRKWDEIALGFVHSLRPSYIRVVNEEETLDAITWRVTVYVDRQDIIKEIRQEVEVALPNDCRHGHDLQQKLMCRTMEEKTKCL